MWGGKIPLTSGGVGGWVPRRTLEVGRDLTTCRGSGGGEGVRWALTGEKEGCVHKKPPHEKDTV